MFCTACGGQLTEGQRFCPQCGAPANKQEPPRAAGEPATKRLERDMTQKSIAGVCSGFAKYLDVDVTLVRIVWLCSVFLWGVGLIAYLVCWIVMPQGWARATAASEAAPAQPQPQAPENETKTTADTSTATGDSSPS